MIISIVYKLYDELSEQQKEDSLENFEEDDSRKDLPLETL